MFLFYGVTCTISIILRSYYNSTIKVLYINSILKDYKLLWNSQKPFEIMRKITIMTAASNESLLNGQYQFLSDNQQKPLNSKGKDKVVKASNTVQPRQ